MKKLIIIWFVAISVTQTTFSREYKLLKPLNILDVESGALIKDKRVLIKDNKIIAIDTEENIRRITDMGKITPIVIDLDGKTILPGLIDAHSHVLLHPYNETSWNDQVLRETQAERVARGVNHLRATLKAGFTSLRDLGSEGAGYADVGLKKALDKGVVIGPRLIVAGRAIVATGSYGPKGFDLSHDITLGAEPADGNDLIRVVRDQIGKGADLVKVYADYRWGPNGEALPTFSQEEFNLIVKTAESSGRVVVAHAATEEGMRRATLAGVKSIEHGDNGTEKIFELMRENSVTYCPTVTVTEAFADYSGWKKGVDPDTPGIVKKRAALAAAMKAGVTICNGSDVGPYTHGDNLRELKIMNEYGLSILKTLQAATIIGADLMGMKNEIGEIKVGYLADIIAVEGNPLEDLDVLSDIKMVMKDGKIYNF